MTGCPDCARTLDGRCLRHMVGAATNPALLMLRLDGTTAHLPPRIVYAPGTGEILSVAVEVLP